MAGAIVIRDMDAAADRAAVGAIDTAFETATVFEVVVGPRRIELVERALAAPLIKRYPIEDVFAHWARWDVGWVAEIDQTASPFGAAAGRGQAPTVSGAVCGFAGVEYEPWHARLVLWHLYVAPARRRSGVARALLARVERFGRECGARRVWLETSNVNVPGIAAYARLGYTLCGVDTTHYEATPEEAETAVYLSRPLS